MCKCHGRCSWSKVSWVLVIIGGVNWGLVGAGQLMGSDWNVVGMILGSWPMVLAVVYLLVGIATVVTIFGGCRCKKCKDAEGNCMGCKVSGDKPMSSGVSM